MRTSPLADVAQVSINELTPDLITKHRIPYVIDELLPDANALLGTVFKLAYIGCKVDHNPKPFKTSAMYTIVHANSVGYIDIRPSVKVDYTRIVTRPGRTVVVPPRWLVVVGDDTKVIHLYDPISALITFFGRVSFF